MNKRDDYLTWFKRLEIELYRKEDCFQLLSSSVLFQPDLLESHLKEFCNQDSKGRLTDLNVWGLPALIEKIAKRYRVKSQNIMLANGASNAIFMVCNALLQKGDHIIVESPVYQPLQAVPERIKANITILKRKPETYRFDLNEMKKRLRPKTKMLIITNLHNPSGTWLSDDDLMSLLDAVKDSPDLHILVDEIYHDFVRDRQKSAALLDPRFISINSLSKVYGLSLLRCGWIIAEPKVLKSLRELHALVENVGSRILEHVSSFVFDRLDEYYRNAIAVLQRNREILNQTLGPLLKAGILSGEIPSEGCIFYPRLVGFQNPEALMKILMERYRTFVVPGHFFGDRDRIRVGFGSESKVFEKNLTALAGALEELHVRDNP